MKIRLGMVSNSSSASFTIPLSAITSQQLMQILNYNEEARKVLGYRPDSWSISMDKDAVEGFTVMDNHDFTEFCEKIGVPGEAVHIYGD